MRFRFCGDLDCPDWVLAEMSTLSRLTSVKMKLLCLQVVKSLEGQTIDYDKVRQITSDAKYDSHDIKRTVAALSFILSSAVKHQIGDDVLLNELQQLGLPKEHSTSLCRTFADRSPSMLQHFRSQSLRLSTLSDVQWRVDYILSSSHLAEVKEPMVQLQVVYRATGDNDAQSTFVIPMSTVRTLLAGLKQAQSIMEGL